MIPELASKGAFGAVLARNLVLLWSEEFLPFRIGSSDSLDGHIGLAGYAGRPSRVNG
jgi:hypothetical protein